MTINIDDNRYEIEIVKKKTTRNTYIRVKPGGVIYVTTNTRTRDKDIIKLIEENKKSVIKMLSKQDKKDESNTYFWYLGNKYDIVYTNDSAIVLGSSKAFIGRSIEIDKWYKKQAKKIFLDHF